MNKSFKYTILTLFLALAFILGSMKGMKLFLKVREKQMLTESGRAVVEAPVRSWQEWKTDEVEEDKALILTLKQVRNVINHWNNRMEEVIHDPVEGQISMEQAIGKGKAWLASMGKSIDMEAGIGTAESEIYSIRAVLGVGKQKKQVQKKAEPYYSFWTIQLMGETVNATVYLNAVTGKVWEAEIILYESILDEIPIESIYLFAESTGIEKLSLEKPKVSTDRNRAVIVWNDGIEVQMDYSVTRLDNESIVDYSQSGVFQETYAAISYELVVD